LSRNTVRKYLVSGIVEPTYPLRKSSSKLDEVAATLQRWLATEPLKSRKQTHS